MAWPRIFVMAGLLSALAGCSGQGLVNALTPSAGYRLHTGLAYGDAARQRLDVYAPRAAAGEAPVVVFFYGGRWSQGERAGYRFVGQYLAAQGAVAVIPDYRLHPEVGFPAFVHDGAAAVAWARRHAADYGGDPSRLFVMGHSAGAHIAAMLATDARYLAAEGGDRDWLAGMIGLAGPYDFLPLTDADLKTIFGPETAWPRSQPVNFVDGGEPPMLLLHGAADATVHAEDSEILAARVEAAGGRARLRLYEGIGHIRILAVLAAPLRWLAPSTATDVARFLKGGGH